MKSLFRPKRPSDTVTAVNDRLAEHRETDDADVRAMLMPLKGPPVRTPEPVPATKGLASNLQRAVDLYEQRANQLQCTIDAATSERSDVIKARDAAKLALEALVTDVMEAAVAADLAEGVEDVIKAC